MDQKTGIAPLYAKSFRSYGAEISLFSLAFPSYWTHKRAYTLSSHVITLAIDIE